jgi:lipid A 3-O-deacylase
MMFALFALSADFFALPCLLPVMLAGAGPSCVLVAEDATLEDPARPSVAAADREKIRLRDDSPSTLPAFGAEGSWWWSVGGGVAHDFGESYDINLHGAVATFIVQDVEFRMELGLWSFHQEGDDAIGLNPNMVFRWHIVNRQTWTFYVDAGIGVLVASDDVPAERVVDGDSETGTPFAFMPRAGAGFTIRLDEQNASRLEMGLRWAHISNARIFGDDDNPARDGVMVYVGLTYPF